MSTTNPPSTPDSIQESDPVARTTAPTARHWRAAGPALIAVLLIGRTVAVGGVDAAIGFAIAGSLLAIAAFAHRTSPWIALLLMVGPIALVTSPARTELSFNLARPDESGWFVFTVATSMGVGLCAAAAIDVLVDGRWRRPIAAAVAAGAALTAVGAGAFVVLLTTIDPQPDLGRDLTATERADLPRVGLVNFAFALPSDEFDDYLVTTTDGTEPTKRFRVELDNPSDVPHTFSVEQLDLDVHVPAGRTATIDVDVPGDVGTVIEVICLVGDHADLGMIATLR